MEENIPSSNNTTTPSNKTTTNATNSSSANNSVTSNITDSTTPDGFRCEITNDVNSTFNPVTNELSSLITVAIHPTTGGHFDLQVNGMDNVEHLKKMISKRLKVAKERICLLYKEKDLRDGSLLDNSVQDGSKIILLPMVETGLLTQKPEQSVMQALESLSDVQVNDFLSGKAPLNLTMRLGDHMMFIQLQLSTVGTTMDRTKAPPPPQGANHHHHHHHPNPSTPTHHHQHNHLLPHHQNTTTVVTSGSNTMSLSSSSTVLNVSGDSPTPTNDASVVPMMATDVISAATSSSSLTPVDTPSAGRGPCISIPSGSGVESPARGGENRILPVEIPSGTMREGSRGAPMDEDDSSARTTATTRPTPRNTVITQGPSSSVALPSPSPSGSAVCPTHHRQGRMTHVAHLLDTRTLAEASRNLSQTLRHLSYQAHNSKTVDNEECPPNCSSRRSGAIIESMHHHGHGVYSGTFSGTLNPALQDRHGHPKRDISTIVHILNDLLGATPQYRRQSARCLEPANVVQLYSPTTTTTVANATGNGSSTSTTTTTITSSSSSSSSSSRFSETPTATNKSQEEYSRLSLENKATRGKMEQLQLMLEERRARRRARRDIRAPYPPSPPSWSTSSAIPCNNSHLGITTTSSSSSSPRLLLHAMDTTTTTVMTSTEQQMLDTDGDVIFAEPLMTISRDGIAADTAVASTTAAGGNLTEDDDDDDDDDVTSEGQIMGNSRMNSGEPEDDDTTTPTTTTGKSGAAVNNATVPTPNDDGGSSQEGGTDNTDPGTPMECDGTTHQEEAASPTTTTGLEGGNGGNPTNEYLKLNPETVVA